MNDTADAPDESVVKYVATLVRGNYHALREISWELGRSIVVSETQMFHLEEHAIDNVSTSDGDVLTKDRFEFEPYDGDEPVGYRFPTETERLAKEAVEASRDRARRLALAKANIDSQPAPASRTRARPSAARR